MAQRNWVPVESKKMDAVDYDPLSRTLYIRFPFQPKKEGKPVYAYANVTPSMFEEMMNSKSKGQYFNAEIDKKRDKHPYSPLGVEPAEKGDDAV